MPVDRHRHPDIEQKIGKVQYAVDNSTAMAAEDRQISVRLTNRGAESTVAGVIGATELKLMLRNERLILSDFLPILEDAGLRVLAMKPYEVGPTDDPEAAAAATTALDGKIEICQNGYDALGGADALVILTDWQEFRNPDLAAIASRLARPVIFDGRNLYDPVVAGEAGIEYHSIGRAGV